MAIECGVRAEPIAEKEFHSLNYEVMRLVFAMHKDLGPLCDEKIYQNELAYRCQSEGFESVQTEVPIRVSYRSFTKTYYMDVLIDNAVMYELKAAEAITGQHRKQALNYLLLTGLSHGKLVNLRPASVQHAFVSTRLTIEKRYAYTIDDQQWLDLDEDSVWLKELRVGLLSDWGAFLDTRLFYDAIGHFRGGEENVLGRVDVVKDSRLLGTQRAHLLNPAIAFKISAVTRDPLSCEHHLSRFLRHTSLRAIQWINFNHHTITFRTLCR